MTGMQAAFLLIAAGTPAAAILIALAAGLHARRREVRVPRGADTNRGAWRNRGHEHKRRGGPERLAAWSSQSHPYLSVGLALAQR
jgi:hypothetical protein